MSYERCQMIMDVNFARSCICKLQYLLQRFPAIDFFTMMCQRRTFVGLHHSSASSTYDFLSKGQGLTKCILYFRTSLSLEEN